MVQDHAAQEMLPEVCVQNPEEMLRGGEGHFDHVTTQEILDVQTI